MHMCIYMYGYSYLFIHMYVYVRLFRSICTRVCIYMAALGTGVYLYTYTCRHIAEVGWAVYRYGVATVSRIDKIVGFFCRISSLL